MLPQSAEAAWALIRPAEFAPLLSPESTARGFTVPGTPPGEGEQQCFIDLAGNASIIEIVEYVEGRRAVARSLGEGAGMPTRAIYAVEPLAQGGCLVTVGAEIDVAGGARLDVSSQEQWRASAQAYLQRLRQVLATQ